MKTKKSKSWSECSKELYDKGLKSGIDIYDSRENLRQKCNKMTKEQRKEAMKTGMDIINKSKKKKQYCYLVYCNKDPIVYSVYSNSKSAIQYAEYLLDYRKKIAKERDLDFGFYHHFYNLGKDSYGDDQEKTIFSCCLRILDKDGKRYDKYPEDATKIQVVRKPLFSSFKD